MPDKDNNYKIEVVSVIPDFAEIASDWLGITHNNGSTLAHYSILKSAIGTQIGSTRIGNVYPAPLSLRNYSGPLVGITGSIKGSGSFLIQNGNTFLTIGSENSIIGYRPVPSVGNINGIQNGNLLGITGTVLFAPGHTLYIQGVTNGSLLGITSNRRFNENYDSLQAYGTVTISGGTTLIAGRNSLSLRSNVLDQKIPVRLHHSNGQTFGISGDALNAYVSLVDLNVSISIGTSLGISNENGAALKICGSNSPLIPAVVIQGKMTGGILGIGTTAGLKISFTGSMDLDDALLIDSLESTSKPLNSYLNLTKENTSFLSNINEKISTNQLQAKIIETKKPGKLTHEMVELTTNAIQLAANIQIENGVHVKSPISNTKPIYVGTNRLISSPTSGFLLDPGESTFIEIDNISKIYARSDFSGQKIAFLGS